MAEEETLIAEILAKGAKSVAGPKAQLPNIRFKCVCGKYLAAFPSFPELLLLDFYRASCSELSCFNRGLEGSKQELNQVQAKLNWGEAEAALGPNSCHHHRSSPSNPQDFICVITEVPSPPGLPFVISPSPALPCERCNFFFFPG